MTNMETKLNAIMRVVIAENEEDRRKAREALLSMMEAPAAVRTKDAETIVREILLELGSPDHLVGHPYVIQAILLVVEDRMYINNITFGLYPQLAVQFDTTPTCVERAMRHLIEVTWTRGDLDVLNKYFGNTVDPNRGKPTNGEFIARIANVVKQRMKNAA